jgi:hypothetical protein
MMYIYFPSMNITTLSVCPQNLLCNYRSVKRFWKTKSNHLHMHKYCWFRKLLRFLCVNSFDKVSTVPSLPVTMAKTVYFPSIEKSWKGDKSVDVLFTPEAGSPKFQTIEATFDASSILNSFKIQNKYSKNSFRIDSKYFLHSSYIDIEINQASQMRLWYIHRL